VASWGFKSWWFLLTVAPLVLFASYLSRNILDGISPWFLRYVTTLIVSVALFTLVTRIVFWIHDRYERRGETRLG
jgi:hypothetical protein